MLIVGLGNPGKEYEATRHNIGAMVLDAYAKQSDIPLSDDHKMLASVGSRQGLTLAIPSTFMNNSGQAVAAIANYYKQSPDQVIVIHDDLDVPLGEVRMKLGGGTAGHNGVASVAHHLSTPDFWRIRLGIGPVHEDLTTFRTNDTSGFVLAPFHADEQPVVEQVINMVCSHLSDWSADPKPLLIRIEE